MTSTSSWGPLPYALLILSALPAVDVTHRSRGTERIWMDFAVGSTRAMTIVSARWPAGGRSPLPPKIAPASAVLCARARVSLPTTRKFCGLSCFAAASDTPTRSMLLYWITPHTTTPATSNAASAKDRAIQRRAICERD